AVLQEAIQLVFRDQRIWTCPGPHWIIAPFDEAVYRTRSDVLKCKAYAKIIVAFLCRFHEWPPQLSPLMILQIILDHLSERDAEPKLLPISVIAKYDKQAAAKLIGWHSFVDSGKALSEFPFDDPAHDLCVEATSVAVST